MIKNDLRIIIPPTLVAYLAVENSPLCSSAPQITIMVQNIKENSLSFY